MPTRKRGKSAAADPRLKRKALETALTQIERSYGKGAIMRMGSGQPSLRIRSISTGAINLDAVIGIGGVPRGRITEVYGPESSGKTTLCLHVIANAQRGGGVAAFIDAEHALDIQYARKLGIDVDDLLVAQPDTGEQALEIAEVLIRSNAVDVIVVDSVAALVPRAEIEGEMGDSHVGLQARLMSQALRKLTGAVTHAEVTGYSLQGGERLRYTLWPWSASERTIPCLIVGTRWCMHPSSAPTSRVRHDC